MLVKTIHAAKTFYGEFPARRVRRAFDQKTIKKIQMKKILLVIPIISIWLFGCQKKLSTEGSNTTPVHR